MHHTTAVVVGAGQCGLAVRRCLAACSIDHVVLERGEVADSWRTQRWDSLRLPFLRRRKSTLIDGAASDARELVAHLVTHLDTLARRRAS